MEESSPGIEKLNDYFSFVFEKELIKEIKELGRYQVIPKDSILVDIGEKMDCIPLLLEGAIKIVREDEKGDEMVLYFLERGDTCAVSFGTGLSQAKSKIRGVTEKESEIIFIPYEKLDEWMVKYASWRSFILESYNLRMGEMVDTIDTLAFMQMDERILKYLRDKAQIMRSTSVDTTHQQVAYDMNTSRVVVSRILKALEKKGVIKLHRNNIEILSL
ncbi:MAG: Crp/Fnr family transcriptional regulator [Flavobacteriaceae bacterium]